MYTLQLGHEVVSFIRMRDLIERLTTEIPSLCLSKVAVVAALGRYKDELLFDTDSKSVLLNLCIDADIRACVYTYTACNNPSFGKMHFYSIHVL